MKQYLDLLRKTKVEGVYKYPAREGMPATYELFGEVLKFNLQNGFPLLTTKKMHFKGILAELLWFLKGKTNIHYLVKNGVHIWDADAYKHYVHQCKDLVLPVKKEFWLKWIEKAEHEQDIECPFKDIHNPNLLETYRYGDCGAIYGHQWRSWNGWFDQINNLIHTIKTNPDSRYQLVTAWNPTSFVDSHAPNQAALPACHVLFQTRVANGKLDLSVTQRSCDMFLGVPYNIASYALLTMLLAKICGLTPGTLTWFGNSVHIYENHLDAIDTQLERIPTQLPHVEINSKKDAIEDYEIEDFSLIGYIPQDRIKAQLSVGV